MPVLKEKNYNLTIDLHEITGYLLYIDKKPIGTIGLKKINDTTCEIVRVFIREEYRKNGYASLLFDKIEKLAKTLGYNKAEMVAWSMAKGAINLYKKLGFISSEEKTSEWFCELKYLEFYKNI